MNFLKLVLLISLSFGIGINNSYSEVMVESEIPEAREIFDTSYLLVRGLRTNKSLAREFTNFLTNYPFYKTKDKPTSTPIISTKRHIWVMQFLL